MRRCYEPRHASWRVSEAHRDGSPLLSGPDEEQWAKWQKPHWTEHPVPGSKYETLILDGLKFVAVMVFLISTSIGLLAGLG